MHVYTYKYAYMSYICIHVYKNVYIDMCIYMYTYIHIQMNIYIYIYTYGNFSLVIHKKTSVEQLQNPLKIHTSVYTTDVSAVWHSRHVCCVTQQTCLLCLTTDMPPHACDTRTRFCGVAGKGQATPCPRRSRPLWHTQDLDYANSGSASQAGRGLPSPPALQKPGLTRKQKLWPQIDPLLLDLDTCLTPEAQNWIDLSRRL